MVEDNGSPIGRIIKALVDGTEIADSDMKTITPAQLEELKKEIDEAKNAGETVEIPF